MTPARTDHAALVVADACEQAGDVCGGALYRALAVVYKHRLSPGDKTPVARVALDAIGAAGDVGLRRIEVVQCIYLAGGKAAGEVLVPDGEARAWEGERVFDPKEHRQFWSTNLALLLPNFCEGMINGKWQVIRESRWQAPWSPAKRWRLRRDVEVGSPYLVPRWQGLRCTSCHEPRAPSALWCDYCRKSAAEIFDPTTAPGAKVFHTTCAARVTPKRPGGALHVLKCRCTFY